MHGINDDLLSEFSSENYEVNNLDSNLFRFILTYVNTLEGIKTQIKNVHWASLKLPNRDKRGAHLYLDDLIDIVSDYQDKMAECATGITGISIEFNSIHGTPFSAASTKELMQYITNKTKDFYDNIPNTTICSGIKSETEVFILNLNTFNYRFKLTE